jgi:hypothetical protein
MDYTERPDSNQSPDETLFNFLADLYGVIGGPPCQRNDGTCNGDANSGAGGSGQGSSSGNEDGTSVDGGEAQSSQNGDGNRRSLEQRQRTELPAWLVEVWQSRVQELIQSQQLQEGGDRDGLHGSGRSPWRLLQDRASRSVHEVDLGQNYRLQVHFLKRAPL